MNLKSSLPVIIQGGMGAGVSNWRLARTVSMAGQLGVVSGTAIDLLLVRRLQLGDSGGHMRRALEHLPVPGAAAWIIERYFVPGGKPDQGAFRAKPMVGPAQSREVCELLVASNFVEVFLAKEGHAGMVGVNYLEKIQTPILPSLYGAMLAGVDVVTMGAGIPRSIPAILDDLSDNQAVELRLNVTGPVPKAIPFARFDPRGLFPGPPPSLARPHFFPIVSSTALASWFVKKPTGHVNGLIIEGPTAGGHNAPPRGKALLSASGEPVYGDRDVVDLEEIRALGLPFWLAGSYGVHAQLNRAWEAGAVGIQVGTLFAYCEESGLREDLKNQVLALSRQGTLETFTDPVASPAGFPFKVVPVDGSLSDPEVYNRRTRICDLGYLREAYEKPDGSTGWRCPAEPVEDYVRKGGRREDTVGRKCLCNGLTANIGLQQVRSDGTCELPLLTSGDDVADVAGILRSGLVSYRVSDVIEHLLSGK